MKIKTCIMLTVISIAATVFVALAADESLALDFRLAPATIDLRIVCRLHNQSSETIQIWGIMYSGNNFYLIKLDDPVRRSASLSMPSSFGLGDPSHMIPAGDRHEWRLTMKDMENVFFSDQRGCYLLLGWRARQVSSQYICLGRPDADGNIAPPVVDPRDPTAKPILAFVFNENQTRDLGFLFLNGSTETVTVEKSLTRSSRIVATAPAIEYTKELFIAGQPSENITIQAGKVGEWRLPWKSVYELIPETDLAKIKEAGGDLDLVWKVGDYESPPLPISLGTINVE